MHFSDLFLIVTFGIAVVALVDGFLITTEE
jgi:hypothetical protein